MNYAVLRIRKGVPGVGRKLAEALGAQEIIAGKKPNLLPDTVIINYGNSRKLGWEVPDDCLLLNAPESIPNASNKLRTLELLDGHRVPCIDWDKDQGLAQMWADQGNRVFVRHTVVGKKGQGIEIIEPLGKVPLAPLYTLEFPKTHEHRVHVFDGRVIDVTMKKRMSSEKVEERGYIRNKDVRNKANGWVFAHNDILYHERIGQIAFLASQACNLDFCGVDVLSTWSKGNHMLNAVVCEVNSAPGMSKSKTFEAYINAIKSIKEF